MAEAQPLLRNDVQPNGRATAGSQCRTVRCATRLPSRLPGKKTRIRDSGAQTKRSSETTRRDTPGRGDAKTKGGHRRSHQVDKPWLSCAHVATWTGISDFARNLGQRTGKSAPRREPTHAAPWRSHRTVASWHLGQRIKRRRRRCRAGQSRPSRSALRHDNFLRF